VFSAALAKTERRRIADRTWHHARDVLANNGIQPALRLGAVERMARIVASGCGEPPIHGSRRFREGREAGVSSCGRR